MMMCLHGGDWQRIRKALQMIGAPTTAKELGVTEDQLIEALVHAPGLRKDRHTILGERGGQGHGDARCPPRTQDTRRGRPRERGREDTYPSGCTDSDRG